MKKDVVLPIIMCLMVSVVLFFACSPPAPAPAPPEWAAPRMLDETPDESLDKTIVVFADEDLDRIIRRRIKKPEGPIYTSDLEPITQLSVGGEDISDLGGLEYCTNLSELYLQVDQIADLSPLASLSNLTKLQISIQEDQLGALLPLALLSNLRTLDLSYNNIVDISSLGGFINLTDLILTENHVSDLSPLESLINLSRLDISRNDVSDLSPLASLYDLTGLNLEGNIIRDISPLTYLANLTELSLAHNQVNDLSPLTPLTNLVKLDLGYNQISDITPLLVNEGLSNGDKVYLSGNPLGFIPTNFHASQLILRGVGVVLGNTASFLHPGVLLAVVIILLAPVMLLLRFYRTNGNWRRRLKRDALMTGIIGAGLSSFFILFTMLFTTGYECRPGMWSIDLPRLLLFGVLPLVLFFGSVAVAWRWERVGGILLVIEGLPNPPLLLSGILFLLSSGREEAAHQIIKKLGARLHETGLTYSLIVTLVSCVVCYLVVNVYVYEMAILGPAFALIFAWLFLIPGIVIAWRGNERAGGILIIVAGLLAMLGAGDSGRYYCLPVHIFFIVTLPLLVAGTLFLLSWREARKHLSQPKDDHSG